VVDNVLSKLPDNLEPLGVPNQIVDASLFSIKPMGMQEVKSYLETCHMLETLNLAQKQKLARKFEPFPLKEGKNYKVGQNNKLHKCLTTLETQFVLKELHKRVVGRQFAANITTKKILDAGYWSPTLLKDIHEFSKFCDSCQKIGGLKTKFLARFVTRVPKEPFMGWVLDFIVPIKPT
jgi:hypothetical protein